MNGPFPEGVEIAGLGPFRPVSVGLGQNGWILPEIHRVFAYAGSATPGSVDRITGVPILDELEAVMGSVETARTESLKAHPVAARIKQDWSDAIAAVVADGSYKVEGSPGKGVWAESVWAAVFDRTITETAQRGFYVVYLVAPDGSRT